MHILKQQVLSTDDVLLVPQLGRLSSRSQAEITPFMFAAPMDTVTSKLLTQAMLEAGEYVVVSRAIDEAHIEEIYSTYCNTEHFSRLFFAVSLSKKDLLDFVDMALKYESLQCPNIALDIAHGDMADAHEFVAMARDLNCFNFIMSGSICTPQAAIRAYSVGCTHLRIGVGPGGVCTTRVQTGCGYPQLSAVYEIHEIMQSMGFRHDVCLIADGGIRAPGDAVKYFAGGADAIMLGSLLSKCIESAGWYHDGWEELNQEEPVTFPIPDPEPIFVKVHRGQASESFQRSMNKSQIYAEGVTKKIKWQGLTFKDLHQSFRSGIASAISYLGLRTLEDISPDTVTMVRITPATVMEGQPHFLKE